MSSVRIVYSELKDSWKAAEKAASYCEDYANEIRKKVTNKIGDFNGGSSGYTNSAAGYAQKKIQELNAKKNHYRQYAQTVKTFHNEAKSTDKDVKNYLKLEGRDFRDSHGMHVSRVEELFVNFFVNIANSNPVTKWIKDSFSSALDWMSEKWHDIKYWYHCEGGKYVIKTIAAVVLTVLAVVALVVAVIVAGPALAALFAAIAAGSLTFGVVWGAIVAVAGVVGAVIALADSLTDTYYNIKAANTFASDPAWAARYDSFDTTSGWLKKYRFESSSMNKQSYKWASAIAVTKGVCAVINIINIAKNSINFVKGLKSGTNWLKMKGSLEVVKKSNASTWAKAKYLFKALKVDYKTITSAATLNQYKDYVNTYNSVAKTLKGFTDATKGLKSFSKFVIKADEKGVVKAVVDYFKGKTTFVKEGISTYKDIKGSFEQYQSYIHYDAA